MQWVQVPSPRPNNVRRRCKKTRNKKRLQPPLKG
nr:MAG TPA: hypothetical protein [Caudoviricetes sp.]